MTDDLVLQALSAAGILASAEVEQERLPARAAKFADLKYRLHSELESKRKEQGINQFFTHQAEAIDAAYRGRDVMVTTGTSSGKTLCYLLPTLNSLLTEPSARALFLYPTKALAQDQLGKIQSWIPEGTLLAGTYDGDTPTRQRSTIRRMAHIILSNPDMLHVGILPNHENWIKFLKSLRVLVLDEAHTYRGVFGSHVAWVVRRLLRLCEWYGNRPQVLAGSATVANPEDLFVHLTGRIPVLVQNDGSPQGRRHFVFVNPLLDEDGKPPSRNYMAAQGLVELAANDQRTMVFCRSRVGVELVLRYSRELIDSRSDVESNQVESYRAGYTPAERRKIEESLFKGRLLGLAATNAMELGVDVGGLDVVMMNGYPGSISSFWQQAGRAGRSGRDGWVVMLAQEDPLEQFLVRNPKSLTGSDSEPVSLSPNNPNIASAQLLCMAHERPISPNELMSIGPAALDTAESMERAGDLEFRAGRFFYPSYNPPAPNVNLRGFGGELITLRVGQEELGSMERWRAMQQAHEGAVYLHRGTSYLVKELNLEAAYAELEQFDANYFTQSMTQSVIEPLMTMRESFAGHLKFSLCSVRLTTEVNGFRQRSLDGESVIAVHPLELPATTYETIGLRVDWTEGSLENDPEHTIATTHALEHTMLSIAPFVAGCDRSDLGGAWYAMMPDTASPAIFMYDGCPGGVGLAEQLFERSATLLFGAKQLLEGCSCDVGCPRCLYSARCEANNDMLSKSGAIRVLRQATDSIQ